MRLSVNDATITGSRGLPTPVNLMARQWMTPFDGDFLSTLSTSSDSILFDDDEMHNLAGMLDGRILCGAFRGAAE